MPPLERNIAEIRDKLIDLESWIYDEFEDDEQAEVLLDLLDTVSSDFDEFANKVDEFKEDNND